MSGCGGAGSAASPAFSEAVLRQGRRLEALCAGIPQQGEKAEPGEHMRSFRDKESGPAWRGRGMLSDSEGCKESLGALGRP